MKKRKVKFKKVSFNCYTFIFKKPIKLEIAIPTAQELKSIYYFGYQDFDIDGSFITTEFENKKITRLAKLNFGREIYNKWKNYSKKYDRISKEKLVYRNNFFASIKEIKISYD